MNNQLDIFSVTTIGEMFNENKASWSESNGAVERTLVLAVVPREVIGPIEHGNPKRWKEEHYQLWINHVSPIYDALPILTRDWTDALDLLKLHRDNQEPLKMQIFRDGIGVWRKPTNVVEYLEWM